MRLVPREELGELTLIGSGGSAHVHQTAYRLPDDPRPMVFKEFRPARQLNSLGSDSTQLAKETRNAVIWRDSLSVSERTELDSFAAWPIAIVRSGDTTIGSLLPRIPSGYFVDMTRDGRPGRMPRDLALLLVDDRWVTRMGIDRSTVTSLIARAATLLHLARSVSWLHKRRIVYGDLNLKNVVLSECPYSVLLLDCDSTASVDDPHRRQANSPFFMPPEFATKGESHLQDTRSDVYKLALCVVRGLQKPGRGAVQARTTKGVESMLGAEALAELDRALSPDPNERPTAEELYLALQTWPDPWGAGPLPLLNRMASDVERLRAIWSSEQSATQGPFGCFERPASNNHGSVKATIDAGLIEANPDPDVY